MVCSKIYTYTYVHIYVQFVIVSLHCSLSTIQGMLIVINDVAAGDLAVRDILHYISLIVPSYRLAHACLFMV